MRRYAIGLGSNLGDRLQHLREACLALRQHLSGMIVSSLYETAPVGGPEQGPYLNAVVVGSSDLDEFEMLRRLHEIESDHSRERDVRWGPRTLDLDIITTDGPPIDNDRLVIPHPRAAEREFVLRPLAEIWPEAPLGETNAAAALAAVDPQGVELVAREWFDPPSRFPARLLLVLQFTLMALVAVAIWIDGSVPSDMSPLRILGVVIGLAGAALDLWAARQLGPALTASPLPKQDAGLVTNGPYRLVRHPIYGGLILLALGASLVFASWLGALASLLLVPLFFVKAAYEEHHLRLRHAGYRAYRRQVRRWFIPYLI